MIAISSAAFTTRARSRLHQRVAGVTPALAPRAKADRYASLPPWRACHPRSLQSRPSLISCVPEPPDGRKISSSRPCRTAGSRCRRAPEVVGTVVARPVARSFKTVDIASYYGLMYDSTVLFESPKREGQMSTCGSVAGLQPRQIWGGVVARPLHVESLTVGILDSEPLI